MFVSPVRMNGLKTASSRLKGRGCGEKPCDTDTGNKQSVGGLAVYKLSLVQVDKGIYVFFKSMAINDLRTI